MAQSWVRGRLDIPLPSDLSQTSLHEENKHTGNKALTPFWASFHLQAVFFFECRGAVRNRSTIPRAVVQSILPKQGFALTFPVSPPNSAAFKYPPWRTFSQDHFELFSLLFHASYSETTLKLVFFSRALSWFCRLHCSLFSVLLMICIPPKPFSAAYLRGAFFPSSSFLSTNSIVRSEFIMDEGHSLKEFSQFLTSLAYQSVWSFWKCHLAKPDGVLWQEIRRSKNNSSSRSKDGY